MTDAVSTEIAQIERTMRVDRSRYDSDPAMQSRLRELYDAAEGRSALPAARRDERAEIERVMKTNIKAYWADEGMQARYRALLEMEETGDTGGGELAPMPTPKQWATAGNDPAAYQRHARLVRETNDILAAMDAPTRDALGASFERLPVSVQSVALGALLDHRAVPASPLSSDDVDRLKQTPAYAALAREWGVEAPRKFAVLQERLFRVLERLGDHDRRSAVQWLDGLSKPAAIALCRKLAG